MLMVILMGHTHYLYVVRPQCDCNGGGTMHYKLRKSASKQVLIYFGETAQPRICLQSKDLLYIFYYTQFSHFQIIVGEDYIFVCNNPHSRAARAAERKYIYKYILHKYFRCFQLRNWFTYEDGKIFMKIDITNQKPATVEWLNIHTIQKYILLICVFGLRVS